MSILQNVVFALEAGSYIAVATVGFTLIYGVINFINFAYGEYMTIGAFLGVITVSWYGMNIFVGLAVAMLVTMIAGWVISRVTFVPMHGTGPIPLLLASIGLGMFLRNFYTFIAGGQARFVDVSSQTYRPDIMGGAFVTSKQLFIIITAMVAFALIHLLLTRTKTGIAMRATGTNEMLSRASGIRTKVVRRNVWLLASALAGISGYLLALSSSITPLTGFNEVLVVLAAAILGGAGSAYGGFIGAYLIGFVLTFAPAYLPSNVAALGEAAAFAVLILALLLKPSGIASVEVNET